MIDVKLVVGDHETAASSVGHPQIQVPHSVDQLIENGLVLTQRVVVQFSLCNVRLRIAKRVGSTVMRTYRKFDY